MRNVARAVVPAAALLLGGCETFWTSNIRETRSFASGQAIATNADVRLVHQQMRPELITYVPGTTAAPTVTRVERQRGIICAEPSPDVARAVTASLTAQADAAAKVDPGGTGTAVDARLAAQFAGARAESVAQLTRRIATMQLLRDGLYRACEAYMNGAIGRTAYTAILANYDTMMMTMMFGETAAGNFGSLATLGGAAAAGGARADMAAAEARLKAAVDTHTAALRAQKEADDAVASKRADLETESKKDQPDASTVSRLRDAVTDADKQARQRRDAAELARSERVAAEQALRAAGGAVSAQAEANAQAGREGAPGGDVGRTLHDLQREYFILPRGTSALLTCMQAADDVAERTIHALPDYCAGLLGSLPQAITNAQTRRYNLQVYEHQLAYVRALADLYRAADAAKIPPAQRQRDLERQPPTPSAPR